MPPFSPAPKGIKVHRTSTLTAHDITVHQGIPTTTPTRTLLDLTDFHWPALGLVVETDGWRYHRTAARQARDNRRMQAHVVAGRTAIRISHHEIRLDPGRVEAVLKGLVHRLQAGKAA